MVVGICGGSGSGKTTLLNQLSTSFDGITPTIFSMDNYYLPIEQQVVDANGVPNFDLPSALDYDRLLADFSKLLQGETIFVKEYAFNIPQAKQHIIELKPSQLIIIEGIFLFYFEAVRTQLDLSVFIDIDPAIQLQRRLKRDTLTRGYSEADVLYQWNNHVLPAYEQFVRPFVKLADFNYKNDANETIYFNELVELIKNSLS